ncbi:MAG TPA: hypothetical protein DCS48_03350 [Desulfovibrio sp.]|nr:hypothetical protein [Desulfovibrio sp.]
MIDLAQSIFQESGFNMVEVGMDAGFVLYSRAGNQTEYWCLVERSLDGFVDIQAEIYDECLRSCSDKEIAKNISLLLIHEGEYADLCKKIQIIEEDQYWFKKHVLCYSSDSLTALRDKIGDENILSQIVSLVSDRSTFAQYKENSNSESWQSLLYRTVLKIPFVEVGSEGDGVVPDLDEIRASYVQKKNLVSFETAADRVLNILEHEGGSIAEVSAEHVVTELLRVMEQ